MRGAIAFIAMLLAAPALADPPDISARRLLSGWKDQDPNTRMLAEVIASAFAGGLSWRGSLAGKDVYCPPPGFKGQQVMIVFEKFLEENPDLGEKPYGDAMAAALSRGFPCQAE
jgi:Rap1a immunity proteins